MTWPAVAGFALVLSALGVLMAALRVWQRTGNPHPEFVRKGLHIGMGLVACALPWLFQSPVPVVVLCLLTLGIMTALRVTPSMRMRMGGVVGGVDRESWGDIYFPIAIGATFVAANGSIVLYLAPVLVMTLADATGALVGIRYGTHRYRATEGRKSMEGSLAFFAVATGSVLAVLRVTGTGWAQALLIGTTIGMLVMALEAVAWRGLDNLFVPMGVFLLLKVYLGLDLAALAVRLVMATGLFGLVLAMRRQTTLNESALLGAAFAAYVFGAVGGWRWLVAPLTLLVSYTTVLSPRTRRNIARVHTVHSVMSVASAGMVWLWFAAGTSGDWLYPCTVSFACHLAIIGAARLRFDHPHMSTVRLLAECTVKSWLTMMIPYRLMIGPEAWIPCLLAAIPIALVVTTFYHTQPGMHDCPIDVRRWFWQAILAALGSVLAYGMVRFTW
jgi:phytol kinase